MRLRWPFRRSAPAHAEAGPASDAGQDEWRAVPPPSGLAGPPTLTADARFGVELAGSRSLRPILAQLAEARRPMSRLEPPPRAGGVSSYAESPPSRPTLRRPVPAPAAPSPADSGRDDPGTALPGIPIPRQLQAVARGEVHAREHAVPPGGPARDISATPLTVVPSAQRAALSTGLRPGRIELDHAPSGADEAAPAPGAAPGSRIAEPLQAGPASGGRAAPTPPRPIRERQQLSLSGPPRAVAGRAEGGSGRRAGLGTPLPAVPAPTSSSPPTAGGPERTVAAGAIQRASLAGRPSSQLATEAASEPTPGPRSGRARPPALASEDRGTADRPGAPDMRRISSFPSASRPGSSHASAASDRPGGAGALAASRRGSGAAQPTPGPRPAGEPASSASGARVRVDRSSPASAAARDLGAHAFTSGDTIVLPAAHGALDRGRGQELLAHELVHVQQQRRLGRALPDEGSGAGQDLEREARSAEATVDRGRSERASARAGYPVASPRPDRGQPSRGRDVAAAASIALSLADAGQGAVDGLSIDDGAFHADGPVAPGSAGPRAGAGTQRAAVSSARLTTPSSEAPGQSEAEMEDLARRLYDRIRDRLRRELLLDRERSGLLTDLR